ncbi:MAG: adenine nucleotide alpha hydrolase, partial [Gammaproteobacteria bacterium]|nr:adenine nucleotide alpha hydrolase [Gammaproteobacteria bacterium]
VGLLSTVTEEYDRVAMHSTRYELLKKQAEQLGIPLYPVFIPASCSNKIYEERMQSMLEQVIKYGITHVVFGDLFLEDIRKYRESTLVTTNITPLFPLWGKNTVSLAREMINAGIKAVLTCVDPKKLDSSFVGRQFDEQLLNDFPNGVDPCGEYGEFHTFVYDGPMFYHPIPISVGKVVERSGYIFVDVINADVTGCVHGG